MDANMARHKATIAEAEYMRKNAQKIAEWDKAMLAQAEELIEERVEEGYYDVTIDCQYLPKSVYDTLVSRGFAIAKRETVCRSLGDKDSYKISW